MFEGIKIVTTLECVRGFVPKDWTKDKAYWLLLLFQNEHFCF